MTSNEPTSIDDSVEPVKTKNKLRRGGIVKIDDDYLDETFHNNIQWECKKAPCYF